MGSYAFSLELFFFEGILMFFHKNYCLLNGFWCLVAHLGCTWPQLGALSSNLGAALGDFWVTWGFPFFYLIFYTEVDFIS